MAFHSEHPPENREVCCGCLRGCFLLLIQEQWHPDKPTVESMAKISKHQIMHLIWAQLVLESHMAFSETVEISFAQGGLQKNN